MASGPLLKVGAVILAVTALAAVLVADRSSSERVTELASKYLGDHTALSAEAARRQANSYFDRMGEPNAKKQAKQTAASTTDTPELRRSMSDRGARNDLNDFFDNLGLTGGEIKAKQAKQDQKPHEKAKRPVVNIYIEDKAKGATKGEKKVSKVEIKEPLHPEKEKEARGAHLSFEKEMAEAKELLRSSKVQKEINKASALSDSITPR